MPSSDHLLRSNECPICRGAMARMIDMPRFPLTEMYEPYQREFVDHGYYDQAFLYCERCVHGKLEAIVPPAVLYGPGYRTRSAASIGSKAAVERFARFIQETALDVETVIDIGGNDASLVLCFPDARKVIVDPHADSGVAEVVKQFVEEADLTPWKASNKLIVSSHTLEHVADPRAFFEKVNSVCMHGDWLAIQVPSLEALLYCSRIDHIHHQHVNYFSRRSLGRLLAEHGFEIVRYAYDHSHWGALMVMCRKGDGDRDIRTSIVPSSVTRALEKFKARLATVEIPSYELSGPVGFGAALMLPVLAYWLPSLANVEYIADNDKAKDGLRYINFNKRIQCEYSLEGRDVVITAIGTKLACRELVRQAFEKGALHVIVPLGAM